MAELLSPGVIIQEVPFGPQPIEGVSTSTAGFVGEALYGPTEGAPTLVTSFPDFQRKFGGIAKNMALGYAIAGFFDNGGRRAYVSRVVGSGALFASLAIENNDTAPGGHLIAIIGNITSTGTTNQYRMTLGTTVGLGIAAGAATLFDRQSTASVTLEVTAIEPSTGVVTVTTTTDISGRSGDRYYVRQGAVGSGNVVITLRAASKGAYGNSLAVFIQARALASTRIVNKISDTVLQLQSLDGLYVGARLQVHKGTTVRAVVQVQQLDPGTQQVTISPGISGDSTQGDAFLLGWLFRTTFNGAVVEELASVPSNPTLLADYLSQRSSWIVVAPATTPTLDPASATGFPTMVGAQAVTLGGGSNAAPADTNIVGSVSPPSGLGAIEAQDGINLIAAPGFAGQAFSSQTVVNALISQAERLKDRFAVFEHGDGSADVNDVLIDRGRYNSQYAAMYHPWLRVRDPLSGATIDLPPSGHVLGAYARTDNERGVFKAPANVVLRGVLGFTQAISTGEQDILNPAGVNVLRQFDGLGSVIWGARTISADTLWKYVPVRRLFIFIEQSIARGTRYAVFEPNAPPLWARIRDSVTNFLTTQWRAGALFGETVEQAFFVKVDETTTTQDDRDNGIVNILVGIAPVKPAEFVVFQIGQAPSSVIIAES